MAATCAQDTDIAPTLRQPAKCAQESRSRSTEISTGLSRDAPNTAQARAAEAAPNRMICAIPANRLPILVPANIRQVSHRS